jgi:polyphosphate glucokinase
MHAIFLGIDVGGSSIKAAPVEVSSGKLAAPLESTPTPKPATPTAIAEAARSLATRFDVSGPVGFAFPSVVKRGVIYTASHVDSSWIGVNGEKLIAGTLQRRAVVLNDADAAGLAEIELGAARGVAGTVLVLTFGTGIGSALFFDGRLLPNTELGHLEMRGREIEQYASGRTRTQERLSWEAWALRVNEVLAELHRLFSPDVFVIGGGVSERYEEFGHLLSSPIEIGAAHFRAEAGIVGAALAAARTEFETESKAAQRTV